MNENIDSYKMRKLIYNIIFNFYENDYTEDKNVFDLVILESLRNIVEYHVEHGDLSKDVKNNINNFLFQARTIDDEQKNDRINICNEIIRIMNNNDLDKSNVFYRVELYKRTKDLGYIVKYSDEQIMEEIENVHDSICNDFYVIASHTEDTNEQDFNLEFLPCFINCDLYYDSINAILEENPSVFRDKTFYDRMMCVLDLNNKVYNNDKKIVKHNKKLIRKINRKIKY